MKETRQVHGIRRAANAGSRIGRLLALLSMLTAVQRGPRRGIVAPLPLSVRDPANHRYRFSGGQDLGRLLR